MAEVVRTGVSVRDQEVTIERPDGSRGTALVNIEALRDADGEVVGAVNCFQDVSERKQAEEKMRILAREVDHRAKNLLSLVQATVHLTKADTVQDFKAAIEGRIKALSNAHTLLAESRWAGVDLRTLVTEELSPYCGDGASRAEIEGHDLILKPQSATTDASIPSLKAASRLESKAIATKHVPGAPPRPGRYASQPSSVSASPFGSPSTSFC